MTTADPLDRLEPDARARLEAFARALERVHVDDLPLHVARNREPRHRRATEAAALATRSNSLDLVVDAARRALFEGVLREYANAQYRVGWLGLNSPPGLGPTDERVRVMRSLGEVVSALILWDHLDVDDRGELLGLWSRLLA